MGAVVQTEGVPSAPPPWGDQAGCPARPLSTCPSLCPHHAACDQGGQHQAQHQAPDGRAAHPQGPGPPPETRRWARRLLERNGRELGARGRLSVCSIGRRAETGGPHSRGTELGRSRPFGSGGKAPSITKSGVKERVPGPGPAWAPVVGAAWSPNIREAGEWCPQGPAWARGLWGGGAGQSPEGAPGRDLHPEPPVRWPAHNGRLVSRGQGAGTGRAGRARWRGLAPGPPRPRDGAGASVLVRTTRSWPLAAPLSVFPASWAGAAAVFLPDGREAGGS